MNEKERFDILLNEKIDKEIYYYLENLFTNLNIEIASYYEGKLLDLMKNGRLEGWCWQTTETAALFMPDDTIVYRGNLYLAKNKPYYHSFIEFSYDDKQYIFDPCLCMINTKDLYFNTFDVDIIAKLTAKEIKDYFIEYVSNQPKRKEEYDPEIVEFVDKFMSKFFSEKQIERTSKEIVIHDKEDPSSPMYRNNSGYRDIDIDNKMIKSLKVHYYMNC